MEILYLLIPLSAIFVLLIIGVFGWAIESGQFEDLEEEGRRILGAEPEPVDSDQVAAGAIRDNPPAVEFLDPKLRIDA